MTALALTGSPLWYASRAGGTLALLLLTATVVLGIASGGRAAPRSIGRFEIGLLHRNLSLLTLVFLVVHVVTAVLDPFVHLGWAVTVMPFGGSYRPLWLGLGTVAFDLLLAVLVTSALRLRIGVRRWKAVHWLAYAAWPFALFHGVGTGTDTRLSLQLWLYAGCLASVVVAVWWRLAKAGPGRAAGRLVAAVTTGAVPVVLTAFLAAGPLQPGWAQRAATTALHLGGGR
ncbi:ferric reductase-like transmembrane domain-containing protein [Streptomyces sp. NBC_00201]|uniref:ferric reductase-like transmembrane domain-containing protein n=1 Tax=unclassified Streptomyces TaxID=2593676 RepID=UPI00225C094A|nr:MULTISPECIES: ferric reductase-like transmembrane domain-containing protein [unclassified Streptomyces]MCX5052990.1 ferric reductase-like transmembrane domain-containing protein [Streptomyces sp. NBC_00474]MCX5062743.1 ferric reductase-like transmembrane domain-containing protein [Streptomyces sp. NBC_00452]MCX5250422.1 ferric reductase-like transmembrane domain-containing protein [Streptomyces sp. NBC_00201]MCX5291651.1 ferric reductase-like transmembrane domain-containing protein [Streptom